MQEDDTYGAAVARVCQRYSALAQAIADALQPHIQAIVQWHEDLQRAQLAADLARLPILGHWADWLADRCPRRYLPRLDIERWTDDND